MTLSFRWLSAALLAFPLAAFASVGQVEEIDGAATRTAADGTSTPLAQGAQIELGDTLEVKDGSLRLALSDESALELSAGSKLRIDEAQFASLDHRQFSATLLLGSVWAKVTHALAGSDSKFEVTAGRALAGVRGTVFSVALEGEADQSEARIDVAEGSVAMRDRSGTGPEQIATEGQAMRLNHRGEWIRGTARRDRHMNRFYQERMTERRRERMRQPIHPAGWKGGKQRHKWFERSK